MDLSSQESNFPSNEWEENLVEKLQEIQNCQKQSEIDSCLKCKKILECDLRKQYVSAVYSSMNKGSNGGFEF